MRRILLAAAFIVALLYMTVPHQQNLGRQAAQIAWTPAGAGEVLLPANSAAAAPTAPIQPLPSGAPFQLVLSTHLALLSLIPATDRVEILSVGHGHYYGVAPLLDRWLLVGSQARLAAPARNASRAVLPPERDALLLVDVPARAVVGSWTLPTRYLHDLVAADDGTLFAVDSETADVAEFAVLLNGSAGEDDARSLPVGPGRRARLAHRRTLRTTTSSLFDSAATAHANNAIATAGLLWVLHNNLQSTSELHLFELATGAPVRTLLLGGPNCHNPLFYKGELLYLLSSSGGLARLGFDGGSTTLWEAGSEWFTKGLAVVDDVAYLGLSRKTRQARDRNFAAMELASFDLAAGRLVRRVPLRVPGLPHERPGLVNAISAPSLAPTCSWRACSTTESRESVAAAHDPDPAAWLPRRRRKAGRRSFSPAAGAVAPAAAAARAAACAARASSYPRTLDGVLSDAQRRHLTSLYFSRVHGHLTKPTYYNLLRALVEAADPDEYDLTRAALGAVQSAVASTFGDGFLVINDFFSYRAPGAEMFPQWHQDYEFWLTGDDCAANFNVWVLLDHKDLNHSFDVYEVERNRWLYDRLHAKAGDGAAQTHGAQTHGAQTHGANRSAAPPPTAMVPVSFFRAHGHSPLLPVGEPPAGSSHDVSRRPLRRGEALVLRQREVHRTDLIKLRPQQWRLAIGFKVLERRPLVRLPLAGSPFSADYAMARLRWPGLLPNLVTGEPFPDVFGDARLREYRAAGAETWLTFASRTLAAVADGSQTSEEAYAWLALLLVVVLAGGVGCALVAQANSPRRKADRATV